MALAAVVAGLISCGGLKLGKEKMDTSEAGRAVVEALKEYVDTAQYRPISVRWDEEGQLSNDLLALYVSMVGQTGRVYTQTYILHGPGTGPSSLNQDNRYKDTYAFAAVPWIRSDDIDPEAIRQQFEAAKAQIPEKHSFQSIGYYQMEVDPETGEKETEFTVNVTEDGKEAVSNAGRTTIEYYELTFQVLHDGTVQLGE